MEQERGESDEQHGVGARCEHLCAIPAKGASVGGGPVSQPDGAQGKRDARDVGHHVPGVRQKRKTVGGQPAHDLDDQDRHADDQDDREGPAICPGGGPRVVMAHVIGTDGAITLHRGLVVRC